MTRHRLETAVDTASDVYDRDRPPVAHIDRGDVLDVHTLNAWGHLERQTYPGEVRPEMFPAHRGHCLIGPIAVRGAEPGCHLAVTVAALTPDEWGFTVTGGRDTPLNQMMGTADAPPSWLLWDIDRESRTATDQHGHRIPISPFLGIVGVAPSTPGEHSTNPPRSDAGGNIDCKELGAGSTLFLPVAVPDALLYLGDGHAAQGDGEVGGTAVECGMASEVVVDVVANAPVGGLHAITPTARLTFGFSADLNSATGDALAAMLDWMQALFVLDRTTAQAIASATVDLRITQVASQTWGVHAVLPHDAVNTVRRGA